MRIEFNVYFEDGNHKILEANDIFAIMKFLVDEGTYDKVVKIERR